MGEVKSSVKSMFTELDLGPLFLVETFSILDLEKFILSSLFYSSSSSSFACNVDPTTFSDKKILPLGLIFPLEVAISVVFLCLFRFIGSLEIAPELLDSAEVAGGRREKYGGDCFFGGRLITAQLN